MRSRRFDLWIPPLVIRAVTGIGAALLGAGLVSGCKPKAPGSGLRTLDQLGGSTATYSCSGKYTDNERYLNADHLAPGAGAATRDALDGALSALPPAIKDRVFFGPVAVRLEAVADVAKACLSSDLAKAYRNQKRQPYRACHKKVGGEIVIYLSADPKDVTAGLVRAIGYYLATVDIRLVQIEDKLALRPFDIGETAWDKARLALAYLDDVADVGGKTPSALFRGLIHPSVLTATSAKQRATRWAGLQGVDARQAALFADYVFAEAVDSYYCSTASRVASRQYRRTAAMLGLDRDDEKMGLLGRRGRGAVFWPYFQQQAVAASSVPAAQSPAAWPASQPARGAETRQPVYSLPKDFVSYDPFTYDVFKESPEKKLGESDPLTGLPYVPNLTVDYDPNERTYSGYMTSDGGRYVALGQSNRFVWQNSDGLSAGHVAEFDAVKGDWSYSVDPSLRTLPSADGAAKVAAAAVPSGLSGDSATALMMSYRQDEEAKNAADASSVVAPSTLDADLLVLADSQVGEALQQASASGGGMALSGDP